MIKLATRPTWHGEQGSSGGIEMSKSGVHVMNFEIRWQAIHPTDRDIRRLERPLLWPGSVENEFGLG